MSKLSSLIGKFAIAKQIPIFEKLSWLELRKIARKADIREYKKGDIICKQGDPPQAFYCLISGRLKSYAVNAEGDQENVEYIHRGKHFGIVSLLADENHPLNFEAINDSVILQISKNDFYDILKNSPQLGLEFSHSLSRKIQRSSQPTKSVLGSTIISIYCPVKGSGSSTYAINLALSLERETEKKVVFVNINSREHTSSVTVADSSEATPQWKTSAVDLVEIAGDHEKILSSISRGELKIDLLNVVFDPNDTNLTKEISQFVSTLANDYHYVVVDLPNEMDEVVLTTLNQSDIVQLISMDRKEDLRTTRQVIIQLKGALGDNFNPEKVQVLISGIQAKCYLSFEEINKAIDHDVYAKLPHIERSQLNTAVVSETMTVIISDIESEYSKLITRFARRIGGVLVGLVLGGGAALGVAHIGVIRVLEEENIPIDIVVGSSMGSLIGSMWVAGRNPDQLEASAREFERKGGMLKLFDPVLPLYGFVGGRAIKSWLRKSLGNKTFYSTEIPLKIVAYDLRRRKELVINSGSLVDAVRKSIAIPGVITPVLEKDQIIIDGGVLNPLPTNVLEELGIKKIIAVNVLQSPEHVSRGYDAQLKRRREEAQIPFLKAPFKYLGIRFGYLTKKIFTHIPDIIVQSLQASEYLLAEQSAKKADVLIQPDLTGLNWFELYRVDELLQSGEDAALKALPAIKKLVKN